MPPRKPRGLAKATLRRREAILAALRSGRWLHGERLRAMSCPEISSMALRHMLRRMRDDGYVILSEGGLDGRGWKLISEPDELARAAKNSTD